MLRAKLRFCEANLQIEDKRATHNRVLAFAVRCPPDFAGFRANPKPARRRPVDDACKELRQHTLQHTRPDQRPNVKNLKILWKLQLNNQPREMHSLFPPLIVPHVPTAGGPKEIAIEAGISDNLYAIDVKAGEVLWQKH